MWQPAESGCLLAGTSPVPGWRYNPFAAFRADREPLTGTLHPAAVACHHLVVAANTRERPTRKIVAATHILVRDLVAVSTRSSLGWFDTVSLWWFALVVRCGKTFGAGAGGGKIGTPAFSPKRE